MAGPPRNRQTDRVKGSRVTDLTRNSYNKLFVSISCDVFLYLEEFQKDNGVNHPQNWTKRNRCGDDKNRVCGCDFVHGIAGVSYTIRGYVLVTGRKVKTVKQLCKLSGQGHDLKSPGGDS
ncbi:hypothetical protein RRG08_044359 [Elysia crispata]|uniref:Uncharacterized protein n=1 Tax=Elysia crispata TaxID=231223 RepID=A0AAE1A8R7_9GAST|nr:hypothetical protein RRG08_044359 [Elysia crispata]